MGGQCDENEAKNVVIVRPTRVLSTRQPLLSQRLLRSPQVLKGHLGRETGVSPVFKESPWIYICCSEREGKDKMLRVQVPWTYLDSTVHWCK